MYIHTYICTHTYIYYFQRLFVFLFDVYLFWHLGTGTLFLLNVNRTFYIYLISHLFHNFTHLFVFGLPMGALAISGTIKHRFTTTTHQQLLVVFF